MKYRTNSGKLKEFAITKKDLFKKERRVSVTHQKPNLSLYNSAAQTFQVKDLLGPKREKKRSSLRFEL